MLAEPTDCRPVAWPAGQEPAVEFRPVQVACAVEQPLGDPMPCIGTEIPEGRLGHAVTETPAPRASFEPIPSQPVPDPLLRRPLESAIAVRGSASGCR